MRREEIDSYVEYAERTYGNEAAKLLLLKVAVCCMPVLDFWGVGLLAPIGIVAESEIAIRCLANELKGFNAGTVLSLRAMPKEVKKFLVQTDGDVRFFRFVKAETTFKNLQIVCDYCRANSQNAVCIFFEGIVPDEVRQYLAGQIRFTFRRFKKEAPKDTDFLRNLFAFLEKNLELVTRRDDFPFLTGAAAMKDNLEWDNAETILAAYRIMDEFFYSFYIEGEVPDSLPQATYDLVREWTEDTSDEEVSEWFITLLWENADLVSQVYERKNALDPQATEDKNILLVDAEKYMLSEELFCEICKPMHDTVKLSVIKEKLANSGVLCGEGNGRNYWSSKVLLHLTDGTTIRKRRVCLQRRRIDKDGAFSWAEIVKMNKQTEGSNEKYDEAATAGLLPGN